MEVITTIHAMRQWRQQQRLAQRRVAVVPTMGFLHEGHLRLVDLARQHADSVILTLFVNPTQFGPNEDFSRYPRDHERDIALCQQRGVDLIFMPTTEEMYPQAQTCWVNEEQLTTSLCGRSRPNHFRGVTTIVAKLFNIVEASVAVFGQKDAQQCVVISRMVRDLNFPIQLIIAPIIREEDGLAMSSRNKYLTSQERASAPVLYATLLWAQRQIDQGETQWPVLRDSMRSTIEAAGGNIDYIEAVDGDSLQPLQQIQVPCLISLAVFFGKTRLIDNIMMTKDR